MKYYSCTRKLVASFHDRWQKTALLPCPLLPVRSLLCFSVRSASLKARVRAFSVFVVSEAMTRPLFRSGTILPLSTSVCLFHLSLKTPWLWKLHRWECLEQQFPPTFFHAQNVWFTRASHFSCRCSSVLSFSLPGHLPFYVPVQYECYRFFLTHPRNLTLPSSSLFFLLLNNFAKVLHLLLLSPQILKIQLYTIHTQYHLDQYRT